MKISRNLFQNKGGFGKSGFLNILIKIRVPGPKSAHFLPPPRARGHGSRLWLCWLRVPRDHRTHTLPERHCKQAMLARGRWQATFTRDTTVLLPRSCTGFFLHASMPSKAKSNSAGKMPMGSGMKRADVCAKRNFQFSIKILFKIRGRRREIWGSK